MTRRTRTALIGGVVIAALLLMGAGFPSKQVAPKHWATGVCTTVNTWVETTKTGATRLEASLAGTSPNLRRVRSALAGYLGDTAHATTRAIDGLDKAGTPKTPKGKQAAEGLTNGFKKIRNGLRKLQNEAKGMSVKHKAKALQQITSLNREVNTEFASFSDAVGKLKKLDPNHQLRKAFQADQACQALSG